MNELNQVEFTQAQQEILAAMAGDWFFSVQDLAKSLGKSESTVQKQLTDIYRSLNIVGGIGSKKLSLLQKKVEDYEKQFVIRDYDIAIDTSQDEFSRWVITRIVIDPKGDDIYRLVNVVNGDMFTIDEREFYNKFTPIHEALEWGSWVADYLSGEPKQVRWVC